MISSHYLVEESGEGEGEADFSTQILAHIYEDLHKNSLLLLSWQPAALPIARNMLAEKEFPCKSSQGLPCWDPVLAIKLLRKATPPAQAEVEEQLARALENLGMEETQHLVFLNLFRESCKPRLQFLEDVFRDTWEQSIAVSRLARELASEHGLTPVDTVATVGLLHNTGKLTADSAMPTISMGRSASRSSRSACACSPRRPGAWCFRTGTCPTTWCAAFSDSFEWSLDHGGTEANARRRAHRGTALQPGSPGKSGEFKEVPALRKLGLQDPRSPQGQRMQNLVIQAVAEARELLGNRPAETGSIAAGPGRSTLTRNFPGILSPGPDGSASGLANMLNVPGQILAFQAYTAGFHAQPGIASFQRQVAAGPPAAFERHGNHIPVGIDVLRHVRRPPHRSRATPSSRLREARHPRRSTRYSAASVSALPNRSWSG